MGLPRPGPGWSAFGPPQRSDRKPRRKCASKRESCTRPGPPLLVTLGGSDLRVAGAGPSPPPPPHRRPGAVPSSAPSSPVPKWEVRYSSTHIRPHPCQPVAFSPLRMCLAKVLTLLLENVLWLQECALLACGTNGEGRGVNTQAQPSASQAGWAHRRPSFLHSVGQFRGVFTLAPAVAHSSNLLTTARFAGSRPSLVFVPYSPTPPVLPAIAAQRLLLG